MSAENSVELVVNKQINYYRCDPSCPRIIYAAEAGVVIEEDLDLTLRDIRVIKNEMGSRGFKASEVAGRYELRPCLKWEFNGIDGKPGWCFLKRQRKTV